MQVLQKIRISYPSVNYLFPNGTNANISLKTFHQRYKRYFEELNEISSIRYLSAHKLRHTYATFLLRSGADLKSVSTLLGHTNLQTTQIYLHTDINQLKHCCEKLDFGNR